MSIKEIIKKRFPLIFGLMKKVLGLAKYTLYWPIRSSELLRKLECKWYLNRGYKKTHGRYPNYKSPEKFTEKLFCRMLEVSEKGNPFFAELADKYKVRDYISSKIGNDYLIPLIWCGQEPKEIPFNELPDRCVIKTNHSSNNTIIYRGNNDRGVIIQKLNKWLDSNFYWAAREYHYFSIAPRVIIEQFIDDGMDKGPLDYRFFCFSGEPRIIQVDNHEHDINPFYDMGWQKIDLSYRKNFNDVEIPKPENFDEMVDVVKKLSEGIDFVRVDLYNVHGKIYFGEMTFTPVAGQLKLSPERWDDALGEMWKFR